MPHKLIKVDLADNDDAGEGEDQPNKTSSRKRRKPKPTEKRKQQDDLTTEQAIRQERKELQKRLKDLDTRAAARLEKEGSASQKSKRNKDGDGDSSSELSPEEEEEDEDLVLFSSSVKPLTATPATANPLRTVDINKPQDASNGNDSDTSQRFYYSDTDYRAAKQRSQQRKNTRPQKLSKSRSKSSTAVAGDTATPAVLDDDESPASIVTKNGVRYQVARVHPGKNGMAKHHYTSSSVRSIILAACNQYEARIVGLNAFPDIEQQVIWARACWDAVLKEREQDEEPYLLTDPISRLIRRRGSRIRGDSVSNVRTLVATRFGFQPPTNSRIKIRNEKASKELLEETRFHYKVPKTMDGVAQNPIILETLSNTAFKSKTADGVKYQQFFNPISLNTLALVMTQVQCCIQEWSSGIRVQTTFSERAFKQTFDNHIDQLKKWEGYNLEVTTNIRKKMFGRLLKQTGAAPETNTNKEYLTGDVEERARKELEGHTGLTDSEDEASGRGEEEDEHENVGGS